jgi:hypothetical protein
MSRKISIHDHDGKLVISAIPGSGKILMENVK